MYRESCGARLIFDKIVPSTAVGCIAVKQIQTKAKEKKKKNTDTNEFIWMFYKESFGASIICNKIAPSNVLQYCSLCPVW